MDVTIDLNLIDYLKHAVRSEKDTVILRQFIKAGLKDDAIKNYFSLILGQKGTIN